MQHRVMTIMYFTQAPYSFFCIPIDPLFTHRCCSLLTRYVGRSELTVLRSIIGYPYQMMWLNRKIIGNVIMNMSGEAGWDEKRIHMDKEVILLYTSAERRA